MNAMDPTTLGLITAAAAVAAGEPGQLERAFAAAEAVPEAWMNELLLQSVLTAGWPRALTAAALWRRLSGREAPEVDPDEDYSRLTEWLARGEEVCRVVYGTNYERLRANVRKLHPVLDSWMVIEGYGRTLARPGLDLRRRELCTVAQCAVLGVPRQLHSHLKGALHAGAAPAEVEAALDAARPFQTDARAAECRALWETVRR